MYLVVQKEAKAGCRGDREVEVRFWRVLFVVSRQDLHTIARLRQVPEHETRLTHEVHIP